MSDKLHPRIQFNDGEGLDTDDLNNASNYIYRHVLEAVSRISGAEMGNAMTMALTAANGMDPYVNGGYERNNLQDPTSANDVIYIPHPYAGPIRSNLTLSTVTSSAQTFDDVKVGSISIEGGVFVQAYNSSTPGAKPTGIASGTPMVYAMSATNNFNVLSALSSLAAPGASFRWDHVGVRLKFATASAESRDFESAATRALTTVSTVKENYIDADFQFVSGAYPGGIAPDPSSYLSTGYGPVLSIKRPSGETEPRDASNFYYWPYPMRLGYEDVFPQDAMFTESYLVDGTNGFHPSDSLALLGVNTYQGTPPASATYIVTPRNPGAGARLIGVGIWNTSSYSASSVSCAISRIEWGVTNGRVRITDLHRLDQAQIFAPNSAGMRGVFEHTWGFPIWCNGHTYGPIFSQLRSTAALVGNDWHGLSKVALRLNIQVSTNGFYAIGPVRFYYLY